MSLVATFLVCASSLRNATAPIGFQRVGPLQHFPRFYLGFDRNKYPGDAALGLLRKTFFFSGYWLNNPPGESSNSWQGKRENLVSNGFGFLVLFNGRLDRELKSPSVSKSLGARDAADAAEATVKEGFPAGTIIFLDQEEGGRLLPEQRAYLYAWVDGVNAVGYRAGIYCSGMSVAEKPGVTITTANDLHDNAGERKIAFFIYNDSCPPSPGCETSGNAPSPQQSGIPFAAVWQFAQSPRRREVTSRCPSHYDPDGNCYAPLFQQADHIEIDVEFANSTDPSSGRGRRRER